VATVARRIQKKETDMYYFNVVKGPVFLSAGVLELTKDQLEHRKQNLEATEEKGQYLIVKPVCFKAGETIGYLAPAGDKSQSIFLEMTPESVEKMEADNQAAAEAKAAAKALDDLKAAEKAELINAAVQAVSAGHVTSDGKPEGKALEQILNRDITAAERDAVWLEIKNDD